LEHFALHTYDLVTPPAFELAEVLEKGLGTLDPGDVLRFVEPESGEVCALRPDMTPQIARMVATRLSSQPAPIRLCYEGTIVRRRQGRARKHRQVPQAGVELYGAPAPHGDEEALRLLASVSRSVGLESFVIDVGHAGISRSLVDVLPAALASDVTDALVHKDRARLEAVLTKKDAETLPAKVARAIEALPELSGGLVGRSGAEVLAEAKELFGGTPAEMPLAEVTALWETIRLANSTASGRPNDDLSEVLRIDLGEVRHFAYYTGIIFHAVAPGPGEAYASGGRYDDLLGRFGHPMPAVGFAMHLDALARARTAASVFEEMPPRVLVAMHSGGETVVRQLRAEGIAAATASATDNATRYAKAHGFMYVVQDADENNVRVAYLRAGEGERVVGANGVLDLVRDWK
jgi:ATP phosphoribosyltransferase regulatory subunit